MDLTSMGLVRFLEERIGPLLNAIGCAWEGGAIQPFQEHFASEHIRDFLAGYWRRRSEVAKGPLGVCAALPGERHHLGLHLVASILASRDWKVLFLGGDTPLADIESCVHQIQPRAVFFSISQVAPRQDTRWVLEALQMRLPADVELVVGGTGAPGDVAGIHHLPTLQELDRWAMSG